MKERFSLAVIAHISILLTVLALTSELLPNMAVYETEITIPVMSIKVRFGIIGHVSVDNNHTYNWYDPNVWMAHMVIYWELAQ